MPRNDKKEFDRWFLDVIVKPTRQKYGTAWNLLGEELRREALRSACFSNLCGQSILEDYNLSSDDAEALGRHGAELVLAWRRWAANNLEML